MNDQALTTQQASELAESPKNDGLAMVNTDKRDAELAAVEENALPLEGVNKFTDFMAQPAVQRAIPAIIAILFLAISLMVYSVFTGTSQRPLFENLSEEDRAAVYAALQEGGINTQIQQATGIITVSDDDFHRAKMLLASQGLPQGSTSGGFEMIRGEQSLGTSQFMEKMRYRLAIEEELASSIATINSIKKARVHLAIPQQSVFIREREKPKASVVVWPHAGRAVSDSQVQSIIHVVASSVPFMDPKSVSVVDSYGNLLHSSTSSEAMGLSNEQLRYRRNLEEMYRSRIVSLVTPFMGQGNVHVEVNADVDFTAVESMTELFPGPTGVRSEQLSERRTSGKEAVGVPGAMSNEVPAEGTLLNAGETTAGGSVNATADKNGVLNHHSTRNFELDRTLRHEKKMAGHLTKLTVAMVLDQPAVAEGEQARPQKSADEIKELIKGAIGFDANRGDSVVVMSTAFEELPAAEELPLWKDQQVISVARQLLIVIAFVALVFFVFRPLIRNVINPGTAMGGQPIAIGADGVPMALPDGVDPEDEHILREGETLEEMKARLKPKKKSTISADMLDTANTYDDKVALVRMLVSDDSRRVANVMRTWLKRDLG